MKAAQQWLAPLTLIGGVLLAGCSLVNESASVHPVPHTISGNGQATTLRQDQTVQATTLTALLDQALRRRYTPRIPQHLVITNIYLSGANGFVQFRATVAGQLREGLLYAVRREKTWVLQFMTTATHDRQSPFTVQEMVGQVATPPYQDYLVIGGMSNKPTIAHIVVTTPEKVTDFVVGPPDRSYLYIDIGLSLKKSPGLISIEALDSQNRVVAKWPARP
ncbi:MAG: hypothetical protein K6V97_01785 [Actinomycetia bacterium]|nr:hypothetical protein [Actinomycetes bacterium]